MTSLISILVQFFTVIYFCGSRSVRENRENFHPAKISCYTVQILLLFVTTVVTQVFMVVVAIATKHGFARYTHANDVPHTEDMGSWWWTSGQKL